MGKLVELKNISKVYTNKNVLRDISLTIDEGEIIAILGGNGTGKSTILRIIAGLERPSSGKVIYPKKVLGLDMYQKDSLNFFVLHQVNI